MQEQKQMQQPAEIVHRQQQQTQQQQQAQQEQEKKQEQEQERELEPEDDEVEAQEQSARKTPGRVTRVLADLMVFVEVTEGDGPLGLVFKPDKIAGYRGEPLEQLGIRVGTVLSAIEWDIETLKVSYVDLRPRTSTTPMSAA